MKNIVIKTIPDDHQRYNTIGDYYTDENGNRIFAVSDMDNWKYEFLVVLHELIESALCQDRKISDKQIDEFDIDFEEKREDNPDVGFPGDDPTAPYFKEHQFATKIEKLVAQQLGVDWGAYDALIAKLDRNTEVI